MPEKMYCKVNNLPSRYYLQLLPSAAVNSQFGWNTCLNESFGFPAGRFTQNLNRLSFPFLLLITSTQRV